LSTAAEGDAEVIIVGSRRAPTGPKHPDRAVASGVLARGRSTMLVATWAGGPAGQRRSRGRNPRTVNGSMRERSRSLGNEVNRDV
jgi:hypothetical protein